MTEPLSFENLIAQFDPWQLEKLSFHGRRLCRQSTNRHSGRRLSEAGLWTSPSNSRHTAAVSEGP
ncbi:hypothetical protein IE4872_PC00204 (plasmid) [Rhizobium gallicum]|uniref:Uncharacterized protein n=1 Tax=Rhizobium gallicum TaxID=56730 RepID=A0A1L5NQT7_9HYPH|nr:hypothetical protein IE4872_PC00204 [Rhizobium gallicum]